MLKYTDKNIIMSVEKASSTPENTGLNEEQLHASEVSKRNFDRLGVSEDDLNKHAKDLDLKTTVSFKDAKSVFNFVHELQAKLVANPKIAENFAGRLNLLSDDKFGPVTLRAINIALSKGESDGLLGDITQGLNAPIHTPDEAQNAPTATYRKPEKNIKWDFARYYSPGKDNVPVKTSCYVKSNDNVCTIGSSSAYNEHRNTGHSSMGAIGANPNSFLPILAKMWADMEKSGVKPPKNAVFVIAGLATNGLTRSEDPKKIEASVANNLKGYKLIKEYLNGKGIGIVKYATLNPYGKKIKAINRFNEIIRQNKDLCVDTGRAVSTPDGLNFKPGMAAGDGLHLSKEGHKYFAAEIQKQASQVA